MYLDGVDLGLGEVEILDSKARINKVEIPIKCIIIYDKEYTCRFTFWTSQEYEKFNDLELNKKTSIIGLIDDYDIDFDTRTRFTINSRENANVYFTRIDTNKYIVNAEIYDLSKCIIGGMENHKTLELEAIIDFNKE